MNSLEQCMGEFSFAGLMIGMILLGIAILLFCFYILTWIVEWVTHRAWFINWRERRISKRDNDWKKREERYLKIIAKMLTIATFALCGFFGVWILLGVYKMTICLWR